MMEQYINKADVIAEIDRRIQFFMKELKNSNSDIVIVLYGLKSFLDTFEVKEIDIEKEARHYLLNEHISPLNEIFHVTDLNAEMVYHRDIENAFKAGIELGLRTQKGE